MYGLKYTVPFKTINDVSAVVNVEEENYVGSVTELTAGSSPFTITLDEGDDLYSPLKLSTAKLCVVGGDYLQDLFSTEYQKHRITCILNNKVVWTGFIKPEMYTQDYVTDVFELEIECISPVYTLEKKKYAPKNVDGTKTFVSLWWLLNMCYQQSAGNYSGLFLPKAFQKSASDASNVLDSLTVSEKNFFDEDGTAWYVKDVLEEIMKLLGWTLHDWNGSFCMQDIDDENSTICTENSNGDLIASGIIRNSVNVQDLGFSGSNHTLDVLPGFNKVSVKCSNYAVSDLLPSEDFSTLDKRAIFFNEDGPDDLTKSRMFFVKPSEYVSNVYAEFLPSGVNQVPKWVLMSENDIQNYLAAGRLANQEDRETIMSGAPGYLNDSYNGIAGSWRGLFGSLPMRYCIYTLDKDTKLPSITDFSYLDSWYFRLTDNDFNNYCLYEPAGGNHEAIKPLLQVKAPPATFSDGAFSLDGKIHFKYNPGVSDIQFTPFDFLTRSIGLYNYEFRFSLQIGEYYFHCNFSMNSATGAINDKTAWVWNKDSALTGVYTIGGNQVQCTNTLYFDNYKMQENDLWESKEFSLVSIRSLNDNYNGISGFIIPIPDDIILSGPLILTLYTPHAYYGANGAGNYSGLYIEDFSFKYAKNADSSVNDKNTTDRVYQNVVNSEYINERDEIELKISSYNNDGSCYSKVVFGDKYLTNNLFYVPTQSFVRPEELLIKRYVSRYNHTRLKLKEDINYSSLITPYSTLTDDYEAGKNFAITGGEIDLKNEKFSVIMTEL